MIRKSIKLIIKEFFLVFPSKKLRVREIERVLSLPLPSVIRYCRELTNEDVLALVKIGSVSFYTANKSSKVFLLEKKLFNLKMIFNSGIVDFLRSEYNNAPLILFGSFSKGEDLEESDIDLFLESSSKKIVDLKKFEKFLNRKIQLFKFKSLKDLSNPHLANNIVNGFSLNNQIEVF